MQKFKLEVTTRQLHILQEATDVYARLLFGQIEQSLWQLFISKDIDREKFDKACDELKKIVFPGVPRNSAVRPKNEEGENFQVAFEIHDVIRHELWKRADNPPKHVVSADPPMQYSKEPLMKLSDITEGKKDAM